MIYVTHRTETTLLTAAALVYWNEKTKIVYNPRPKSGVIVGPGHIASPKQVIMAPFALPFSVAPLMDKWAVMETWEDWRILWAVGRAMKYGTVANWFYVGYLL